ncbi:MAG: DMT family transporter [Sphingobium sp.]|nr:DMT family transporter [Sphingobium sp.]
MNNMMFGGYAGKGIVACLYLQFGEGGIAMHAEDNRRVMTGILLAIGAYIAYPMGDAMVKAISNDFPGTGISALRYVFSTIVLGIASYCYDPIAFRKFPRPLLQIGRGAMVSFSTATFFVALGFLPLGAATVIMYLNPVIIVILSSLFLGEKVPKVAWVATLVAFLGVIIVIRPNIITIGWVGLLPLVTALCMAIFIILNRLGAGLSSIIHAQFLISLCAMVISSVLAICGHFSGIERLHLFMPSMHVLLGCAFVAMTATAAHGFIIMAAERVEAGRIAPFAYTQLLVAVLLGVVFFRDRLDAMTLLGGAMIVGAGLATWKAQRKGADRRN